MKQVKQFFILLLALTMLLPMLVACKGGDNGNDGHSGELTNTQSIVPEDVTFEGETFDILCREDNAWGEFTYEIMADEGETELVNQAVYERNLEVEERFGIDINMIDIPGNWAVNEDFLNTFRNSVLANSGSFDLVMSQQCYMAQSSLIDLYYNFYEVPYIKDNLDAEYYYDRIINDMTIDGKLFYLLGDYSLTYWEYAYVLYFNKTLAENYGIGDLYQLVKDGEWTFDKMVEYAKGNWFDLNGDGYPDAEDSFGYISDISNTTDVLNVQFDVQSIVKNEAGEYVVDFDQAKMVNILEKFIEFKKTDDVYTYSTSSSDTADSNPGDKIFTEGRSLFYPERLRKAQEFRGMETDFGIIPYPKWDANQDKYYTKSQDGYSIAVIPIDAPNVEMCGAVLDVLSAISYETVIPAYYDMALKDKYARDDDSGEMLDLIREGFKEDFGTFYGMDIGMGLEFRVLISQDNSNFVSYYAVNKKSYERNLRKMLEAYASIGEE